MNRQLIFLTVLVPVALVTGCSRADTDENARRAATAVRTVTAEAGNRFADSWLTTKIQAQYFADNDIKSRDIHVRARNGVVTLSGMVDSEDVRQEVVNVAKYTDGVREVDDRLSVGSEHVVADSSPSSSGPQAPVGTGGTVPYTPAPVPGRTDDASVTAFVQSKYFLDNDLKVRHIEVETSLGIMTLRGEVASDNERAKALLLARMTPGVERVEDALTVNAALAPASGPGSSPAAPEASTPATAAPVQSADAALADKVKSQLSGDPQLKKASIEVSVKDGVALMDGKAPSLAAKQRALALTRQTDGIVQVIDRITVRK